MFYSCAGLATEEPDAVSFGSVCTGSATFLRVLFPYLTRNLSPAHPRTQCRSFNDSSVPETPFVHHLGHRYSARIEWGEYATN